MGIFTRFRDIISSNINAMLDKAEDPEKLIKLMIREMEDTLVEIKASCAGVMASMKKIQRQLDEVQTRIKYWGKRTPPGGQKGAGRSGERGASGKAPVWRKGQVP